MAKALCWLFLVLLVFGAKVAEGSQGSEGEANKEGLTFSGSYFVHGAYTSSFPLSEKGATLRGRYYEEGIEDGMEVDLHHRLRVRADLGLSKAFKIVGEGDFAGRLGGDTTPIGRDFLLLRRDKVRFYDRSTLRQLYLEWRSSAGQLRLGQMTSSWGLGILANDGSEREALFEDCLLGDLVERIFFVTRPFGSSLFGQNLYLAVGGDLVFRDENASLLEGDKALEAIGSLFYSGPVVKGGDRVFLGIYSAYRYERFANEDVLTALALDGAFRQEFTLDSRGSTLQIEAEGVFILGSLRFGDKAGPERAREGVKLRQYGAVLRGEAFVPDAGLRVGVEAGIASGDKDPSDDVSRAFRFDPDYHVGMILFQEVLGRMSAVAVERVADPALLYKAPSGYKTAATNGAVTNAVYIFPTVRYFPFEDLELRASFLWARGVAPVGSIYNSAAYGGYLMGYRVDATKWSGGAWEEKDLGIEVDGGFFYTVRLSGKERLRIGALAGIFRPGSAFNDEASARMARVYKGRLLADILF